MKRDRELETIAKGFANHRRIAILRLLKEKPELSVIEIAEGAGTDFQNASQHIAKLFTAGLVTKRRDINMVRHSLTPLGIQVLRFLKQL